MGRKIIFWIALLTAGAACAVWSYSVRNSAERQFSTEAVKARDEALRIQRDVVHFTEKIVPSGLPFQALLEGAGVQPLISARMTIAAEPVFNLRHLRAGNRLAVGRSVLGELREIRYQIDPERMLRIFPQGGDFHSEIQTIPSESKTAGVSGEIHDSLFESIVDAGEKPELAMRLAEIFAYDLDFYTDPRPGDMFRVVVEKKVLENGSTISYGRILAAEYNNAGHAHQAVLFHDPSGNIEYFTPEGKAMKKAFLHSPLKFAAPISSHFSAHRFHPILKAYRPHLGIDYAAPTGTPVQTIGDGKVVFAGPKGGAGNLVEIQHANGGYTTYYMHLSRVLVRAGERVQQGQKIGLVGMTGLATGPHLDFRIQRRGEFLNFEKLGLPSADPVAKRDWHEFAAMRDRALAFMPSLPSQQGTALAKNIPVTSPSAGN